MSLPDGIRSAAEVVTEAQLQQRVEQMARFCGWLVYHPWRSYKSETGFPDLVMVRPPRVIIAELKTMRGTLSKGKWNKRRTRYLLGQDDWKAAFEGCPGVEYYLWRPSDIDEIDRLLAA